MPLSDPECPMLSIAARAPVLPRCCSVYKAARFGFPMRAQHTVCVYIYPSGHRLCLRSDLFQKRTTEPTLHIAPVGKLWYRVGTRAIQCWAF